MALLPRLQVFLLLAEDRFSGRQFARFRGSALRRLQVLREGFGPVDFCVQLRLETGRFRLRLELAPLSRFVRRVGGRLEGLDLFGQGRQLPFTGLNCLPGIIEVACMDFVPRIANGAVILSEGGLPRALSSAGNSSRRILVLL